MDSNVEKRTKDFKEVLAEELEKIKEEFSDLKTEPYKNGKTVTNTKKIFPKEDYTLTKLSSTLLIPEKYLEHFRKRVFEYKGVRSYVAHLLFRYRIHIANGIVPVYSKLTTKYQEKNQNLHKFSFRPATSDWAELKLYRTSFGMSISAFLVYLVVADSVEFAQTVSHLMVAVGIPTVIQLDFISKVYLWNKRLYSTIVFQFRESPYD